MNSDNASFRANFPRGESENSTVWPSIRKLHSFIPIVEVLTPVLLDAGKTEWRRNAVWQFYLVGCGIKILRRERDLLIMASEMRDSFKTEGSMWDEKQKITRYES